MHRNQKLLEDFYAAFARRDGEAMAKCYAPNARFRDPAFTLEGDGPGWMWRMLCERGKDLRVEASQIIANDTSGSAHWEAHYTFSATGGKVHNIIEARFEFENGLIVSHVDTFPFDLWARQALGTAGRLFGGFGFFQRLVGSRAMKELAAYRAKRS
jgi:ketosteroid isomerase-like protein